MLRYLPDSDDIDPEILSVVSAVPNVRGYRTPPAGVTSLVSALASAPQGSAYVKTLSGASRTYAGTSTKLWEAGASSWTDRSRGGNYSIGTARWRFCQFGDTTLAINKATVLQSSTGGSFADVANSPKAALIEAAAGFVMLANTDDSSLGISGGPNADQTHRWWCSQIFNPTGTWAPSITTQATSGLLVETEGAITGLRRLLNDIVAYKEKSIYVGQYIGPPAAWQWRCVSQNIGCASHEAIVNAGTVHYFIGDDDIYAFDGSRPVSLGAGVREWFFAQVNRSYLSTIQALHDRATNTIYWFYPSSTSTTLDKVLAFHYISNRWGAFDLAVVDVLESVTSSVTYDSLGTYYTNYDDMPNIAYDAPFWNASTPILSYFPSTYVLTYLSGTATSASLRTGWYGSEDIVTTCTRVRPRYRTKPSTSTITPHTVFALGDNITVGTTQTVNGDRFDVLQSGRYHRFDITFSGSMEVEAIKPTLKPESEE